MTALPAIIHRKLAGHELSVARSYFDYLHSWLKDGAVEFGD